MRVSTMIRISPPENQDGAKLDGGVPDGGLIDRITDFGRQVEARGFPGIWIGDSLGRGRPTLDSLQVLRGKPTRVCPLECTRGYRAEGGEISSRDCGNCDTHILGILRALLCGHDDFFKPRARDGHRRALLRRGDLAQTGTQRCQAKYCPVQPV